MDLVVCRPEGLYCAPGDFCIDPWQLGVRAAITRAHDDPALPGHRKYLAVTGGAHVLCSDPVMQNGLC